MLENLPIALNAVERLVRQNAYYVLPGARFLLRPRDEIIEVEEGGGRGVHRHSSRAPGRVDIRIVLA